MHVVLYSTMHKERNTAPVSNRRRIDMTEAGGGTHDGTKWDPISSRIVLGRCCTPGCVFVFPLFVRALPQNHGHFLPAPWRSGANNPHSPHANHRARSCVLQTTALTVTLLRIPSVPPFFWCRDFGRLRIGCAQTLNCDSPSPMRGMPQAVILPFPALHAHRRIQIFNKVPSWVSLSSFASAPEQSKQSSPLVPSPAHQLVLRQC
mmetsp:Transcript_15029/g.25722  ORF Transcript_15029/g.25722 Transcript_15029/m.25722 type:complete len:205 (-) Transcript_15029:194-808(-)